MPRRGTPAASRTNAKHDYSTEARKRGAKGIEKRREKACPFVLCRNLQSDVASLTDKAVYVGTWPEDFIADRHAAQVEAERRNAIPNARGGWYVAVNDGTGTSTP